MAWLNVPNKLMVGDSKKRPPSMNNQTLPLLIHFKERYSVGRLPQVHAIAIAGKRKAQIADENWIIRRRDGSCINRVELSGKNNISPVVSVKESVAPISKKNANSKNCVVADVLANILLIYINDLC